MKRCSRSLIIREIQTKTTMEYYLTYFRMAITRKAKNNKCDHIKLKSIYTAKESISKMKKTTIINTHTHTHTHTNSKYY